MQPLYGKWSGAARLPEKTKKKFAKDRQFKYNDFLSAGVAQQVEQLICNQRVGGSIPSASSTEPSVVRENERYVPEQRGDTQAAKGGRL